MIDINSISAKATYNRLADTRQSFIDRAKEASKLTIPQLYPDSEDTSSIQYPTPYQSLGARGVNNLANKIVLSLFPPSMAFFKLGINVAARQESGTSEGEMKKAMLNLERNVVNEMEISQFRAILVEIMKQGIVGGSSLIYVPTEGKPRFFSMRHFVIKRSKGGVVLKLVTKECVNYLELSPEVQKQLPDLDDKERDGTKDLDIYTMAILNDEGKYSVVQEVKGTKLKGTEATYLKEDFPYVFVPFVDRSEDWGRSYVEDYIGDLKSYEGLRQAILEAAAESARIIYLVKPNAVITPKKLEKAKSGDVLLGSPDDVSALQADKRLDVSMAQTEAEVLRTDLSTIFLLDSAVRRNAERVTAEEIRRVSQELETAFGGIYSTLANVLQEPSVRLFLKRLVKRGLIPDVLKKNLNFEITTGSAALGRGSEYRALESFMSTAVNLLGQDAGKYLNIPEALNRMAYSLDVNTGDLVKTQDELDAEANLEQQRAMQQKAVQPAINAAAQQQNKQGN